MKKPTHDLVERDQKHVWHPYAGPEASPLFAVESAQGVHLQLSDGRELIDGMSSWWAAVHGYNHPRLNQAAKDQIDKMAHVMFGGITFAAYPRLASCSSELAHACGSPGLHGT